MEVRQEMNFWRPYSARRRFVVMVPIFAWAHLWANALFALFAVISPYSSPQTSWRRVSIVILFAHTEQARLLGNLEACGWKASETEDAHCIPTDLRGISHADEMMRSRARVTVPKLLKWVSDARSKRFRQGEVG